MGPRPPAISRVSRRHIAGQLDYQAELDHIGITLEGYRTELLAHGMHPGEGLETVISCMRYELEAELLRNMHGDFSRPVLRPDLAAVAEKAVAAGIDQYKLPPLCRQKPCPDPLRLHPAGHRRGGSGGLQRPGWDGQSAHTAAGGELLPH